MIQQNFKDKQRDIERLYIKITSATDRDRQIEDAVLDKVSEHTASNRAAQNMKKKVKDAKNKCRIIVSFWVNFH